MFGLSKSNGIDHRIGNQFTVENTEFFVKSQSICGLNDVIEIFPGIINFAEGIAFGAHNQLVRFNLDQIAFIAPDSRQPDDVPLVIGGMEQRAGHTVHTVAQARDAFKGHYRQGIAGGVIFAGNDPVDAVFGKKIRPVVKPPIVKAGGVFGVERYYLSEQSRSHD